MLPSLKFFLEVPTVRSDFRQKLPIYLMLWKLCCSELGLPAQ